MLAIFLLASSALAGETRFIIELFRHGARIERYPLTTSDHFMPNLLDSDLTPTGLKEHYLLGQQLRTAFRDFFPVRFDVSLHTIYASNRNRTIDSAFAHMMGLYSLGTGPEVEVNKPDFYNPPIKDFNIPFTNGTMALPYMFAPTMFRTAEESKTSVFGDYCKYLDGLKEEEKKKQLQTTFISLFRQLKTEGFNPREFHSEVFDMSTANKACDFVVARAYSQPNFNASETLIDQCHYLHAAIQYIDSSNPKFAKMISTPIFKVIKQKLLNLDKSNEIALTFSGHDTTVTAIMSIFHPDNYLCILNEYRKHYAPDEYDPSIHNKCILTVKFTANVIFEVFMSSNTQKMVAMRYNNEPLPVFGGKSVIKLEDFMDIVDDIIDNDYDDKCVNDYPLKWYLKWLLVLSWVLIGFLVLVALCFAVRKKRNREQSTELNKLIA